MGCNGYNTVSIYVCLTQKKLLAEYKGTAHTDEKSRLSRGTGGGVRSTSQTMGTSKEEWRVVEFG